MKALFDFFPVVAFFVAYMAFGQDIYLATKVMMAATAIQIPYLLVRRQPISFTHIASAVLAWGLGGMALALHNPLFIKWKPTILYWLFAGALLAGRLVWHKNFVKALLSEQITVPDAVWDRLAQVWIGFFALLGVVNLAVAYSVSTEAWVNFKLFGLFGITLAFMLGLGIYLARHLKEEASDA